METGQDSQLTSSPIPTFSRDSQTKKRRVNEIYSKAAPHLEREVREMKKPTGFIRRDLKIKTS